MLPKHNAPVYSHPALHFINTFLAFQRVNFHAKKCKAQGVHSQQRKRTHNDPLRNTWDRSTILVLCAFYRHSVPEQCVPQFQICSFTTISFAEVAANAVSPILFWKGKDCRSLLRTEFGES